MSERGNGFTLMSAGASFWEGEQLLMSALPLTCLPASSPRIVTGRRDWQADEEPRKRPEMVRGCTKPDVIVPA